MKDDHKVLSAHRLTSGILQHEIERSLTREGSRFRPDSFMHQIINRIRKSPVGDNDLPNTTRFHTHKALFQSLHHHSTAQNRPRIVDILIKGSTLRTTLGLEGPTEVADRVPTPIKDDAIAHLSGFAVTRRDITVAETSGRLGKVTVLLHKLGRFFDGVGDGGYQEGWRRRSSEKGAAGGRKRSHRRHEEG